MKPAFLFAVLLALVPLGASAADDTQKSIDISGNYAAEGDAGNGGVYKATAVIIPQGNEGGYRVEWKTGDAEYSGAAVRDGDRLAVAIRLHDGDSFHPEYTGVIIYRITAGPGLEGKWTASALEGKVYREFLTYTGPLTAQQKAK